MTHHENEKVVKEGVTLTKLQQANNIIKNRVLVTAGTGLIPLPLVDLVALFGVQIDMLRVLAKLYNVPFRKDIGKSMVASLLGGVLPVSITPAMASLFKMIPIIGTTTGAVTMSIMGGAFTYAVGKVFIQHFESGGTFLDFNPEKVKEYFRQQYEEGKKVAEEAQNSKESQTAEAV